MSQFKTKALLGLVFCRLRQFAAGLQWPVTSCSTAAVTLVVQPRHDNNREADISIGSGHYHTPIGKVSFYIHTSYQMLGSLCPVIRYDEMTPLAGARLGLPAGKGSA